MAKTCGIPAAWMPSLVPLPSAEMSAHHHTFLLREVPEISDIKFVDFTISYTAMLKHIYDEMHPHRAKSLGLKILPLSAYNSEILMPTLLQLHCFHRPGGGGYPAPFPRSNAQWGRFLYAICSDCDCPSA
jgi:hypothetical protein